MGIDNRAALLRLRDVAARITLDGKVRLCGIPYGPQLRDPASRPKKKCDRVWECPWCTVLDLPVRRADIRWRVRAAREVNSEVLFVTLNISHQLCDAFDETVRMLDDAYEHLLNDGRRGTALRRALGIWLIDKTAQVSVGSQGFHPHYHLLLFLRPGQSPADHEAIERTLTSAWQDALDAAARRAGRAASEPDKGVDVRAVTDPEGLALYLTMPPIAAYGPTGPFIALAKLADHGDGGCRCNQCRRWFSRWREYTVVMFGRKRFWARGVDKALMAAGASPGPPRLGARTPDVSQRFNESELE